MEDKLKSLTDQLKELTLALRNHGPPTERPPAQLFELVQAANTLSHQCKGYVGYLNDISISMAQIPATGLFAEWGAFDLIPRDGAISYSDLAAKLDADTSLISSELTMSSFFVCGGD